jgi:hypothetical protein
MLITEVNRFPSHSGVFRPSGGLVETSQMVYRWEIVRVAATKEFD